MEITKSFNKLNEVDPLSCTHSANVEGSYVTCVRMKGFDCEEDKVGEPKAIALSTLYFKVQVALSVVCTFCVTRERCVESINDKMK